MDIVAEAGTGFAFPSQTAYLARDAGLDPDRAEAAEQQVRQWASEGQLPFPEFGEEAETKMQDSLEFPPPGSPNQEPQDLSTEDPRRS